MSVTLTVDFAVPMSMPRGTDAESMCANMAPQRARIAIAIRDLPAAVGPTKTMGVGIAAASLARLGVRTRPPRLRRAPAELAPVKTVAMLLSTRSAMRKQYSVAEAKNQLSAVVHEVEAGDSVEITRHGRPVVVMMSVANYHRMRGARGDPWEAYEAWRGRWRELTDEDVEALSDPGRGAESAGRIDW